jgi:hypothetical protein
MLAFSPDHAPPLLRWVVENESREIQWSREVQARTITAAAVKVNEEDAERANAGAVLDAALAEPAAAPTVGSAAE